MNSLRQISPTLHVVHENEILRLNKKIASLEVQLKEIRTSINHGRKKLKGDRIKLQLPNGFRYIQTQNIVYCQADGNYCRIFVLNPQSGGLSDYLIPKTLKMIEEQLNGYEFIRCHQSYVINKNFVVGFSTKDGIIVSAEGEKTIPVSRRKKSEVMELLI